MRQSTYEFKIETKGFSLIEITEDLNLFIKSSNITTGLLTLFIKHTSASLTINENADPDVKTDLINYLKKIVPAGDNYIHSCEGYDDMPAHIKTALTNTQLSIPVINGRAALGTWQGVYVFEHRQRAHTRSVVFHLLGE
jgi:secondary thiamine-phosphate synthase enzyme